MELAIDWQVVQLAMVKRGIGTWRELATATGLSVGTLSRARKGQTNFTARVVESIADVLGVAPTTILKDVKR